MATTSLNSLDDVVVLLNGMLRLDRATMEQFAKLRFSIGETIARHPAMSQCFEARDRSGLEIAFLGVLNGLLGGPENEWISAVWSPQGELIRFQKAVA